MDEEQAKDKVNDGWIQARAFIEVMAVDKGTTEKSLKQHIEKIKNQENLEVYKEEYDTAEEVDEPPGDVPQAYSQIAEIELVVSSVKNLITFTFMYGPSSVEIIRPESTELKMGELQDMANTIAALVHQYASQGAGGILTTPE
ncbi:MAG: hypothetical protein ABEJ72_04240 [Candidatus Aenigmatarchaeota archaeon]